MTDQEKMIRALQYHHDEEERRHRELLDALRKVVESEGTTRLSTSAKIQLALDEADQRVIESGAKTPREKRRAQGSGDSS